MTTVYDHYGNLPIAKHETITRRSRKGRTTFRVTRHVRHTVTNGDTSSVDPVIASINADMPNRASKATRQHVGRDEQALVAAADRLLAADGSLDALKLTDRPWLNGRRGELSPQVFGGRAYRGMADWRTPDDDAYCATHHSDAWQCGCTVSLPTTIARCALQRDHAANAQVVDVEYLRRSWETVSDDVTTAVRRAEWAMNAASYGDDGYRVTATDRHGYRSDTTIADAHVTRRIISRRRRNIPDTVDVIGTRIVRGREVPVYGASDGDAMTFLLSWTDTGYFIGHGKHVTVATRDRKAEAQRSAQRAAATLAADHAPISEQILALLATLRADRSATLTLNGVTVTRDSLGYIVIARPDGNVTRHNVRTSAQALADATS